jgi:acyl carrier protein
MSAKTFTQEQILSGIRICLREELKCESPFDADTNLREHLAELDDELDAFDLVYLIDELEELFGFTYPLKEWEKILTPDLTFRGLADFIRERLNPISFEPVTLLGKPCLTAGIFRSLEQLAVQVNPWVTPFAPSTPIRQCLHGVRLRWFWNRLRWMIHDEIPPPPRIELSFRDCLSSLLLKIGIGLLIALRRRDLTGLAVGVGVTFALFIPMAWLVEFINSRLNPLPEGIETFGDLARVLSAIILDQQTECA